MRKHVFLISCALILVVGAIVVTTLGTRATPSTISASYDENASAITVTGTGFSATQNYTIRLLNQPNSSLVALQAITTDAYGNIEEVIYVEQLSNGIYDVIVTRPSNEVVAEYELTIYKVLLPIQAPAPTPSPTTMSPPALPPIPPPTPAPLVTPPPTPVPPITAPLQGNDTGIVDIPARRNPETGVNRSFVLLVAFGITIASVFVLCAIFRNQLKQQAIYKRFIARKKRIKDLLD